MYNIGLITPHKHPSRHLMKVSDFVKPTRSTILFIDNLFNEKLRNHRGEFKKPASW